MLGSVFLEGLLAVTWNSSRSESRKAMLEWHCEFYGRPGIGTMWPLWFYVDDSYELNSGNDLKVTCAIK